MKDKNHVIISIYSEKAFDEIQHPCRIKISLQSGNWGSIPKHNKGHIQETYCQHTNQWAKRKSISLKIRNKKRVPTFTILIQHSTGSSSHSNQTSKRNKRHPNWKGGSKLSLFADNVIVYIENPVVSTKKTTQPNKWIWQNSGIQSQYSETDGILYNINGISERKTRGGKSHLL